MKIDEILSIIKDLAQSQGSYTRLYNTLMDLKETDQETYLSVANSLEAQNFQDSVDLVLWLEG